MDAQHRQQVVGRIRPGESEQPIAPDHERTGLATAVGKAIVTTTAASSVTVRPWSTGTATSPHLTPRRRRIVGEELLRCVAGLRRCS